LELGLIFLTGIFLSLHCVGMCGGFVAMVSVSPGLSAAAPNGVPRFAPTAVTNVASNFATLLQNPLWRRIVLPQQLIFNAGRIASYTMLGAAAGALGSLSSLLSKTGKVQASLMVAAGLLMIATGLALAGLMRHWSPFKSGAAQPQPWLAQGFAHVMRLPRPVRALPLGALLGFLPCGLIYAMLGKAASSGSSIYGAFVMLAFGLGTLPALLLVAFFADLFSLSLREKLVRASGALLSLLGAITLYRGILWLMNPAKTQMMHDLRHMVM
jgi:sulfite exporter TauE/SafE